MAPVILARLRTTDGMGAHGAEAASQNLPVTLHAATATVAVGAGEHLARRLIVLQREGTGR